MSLQITVVVLSALASLIAVPITDGFRISLGIVVLIAAIHAFHIERPIRLALITGVAVCLTRILFDSFRLDMTAQMASVYFLEVFFYLGYGAIYTFAVRTNTSPYPLPLVVALSLADMGGNFFEYALRHLAADEAWAGTSLVSILLAAFVRSVLIVFLVWALSSFAASRTGKERSSHD